MPSDGSNEKISAGPIGTVEPPEPAEPFKPAERIADTAPTQNGNVPSHYVEPTA